MNHHPHYQTNNQYNLPLCSKCGAVLPNSMSAVVKTIFGWSISIIIGVMVLAFIVVKIS